MIKSEDLAKLGWDIDRNIKNIHTVIQLVYEISIGLPIISNQSTSTKLLSLKNSFWFLNENSDKVPEQYKYLLDGNVQTYICSGRDEDFLIGYEIIKVMKNDNR